MTISLDRDTELYRYHFMAAGTRYTKRGYPTQQKARDAEHERRRAVAAGPVQAFATWSVLVSAYLAESARTKSADWCRQLGWKLARWTEEWETLSPEHIRPAHIALKLQEIAAAGNGPRSVNEYRRILHAVFGYAVKLEALARNPVANIDRAPEPDDPLPPISTEHLRRLILAAEGQLKRQLVVQASTGARWIELARLRPEVVHLDAAPPYCELRTRKKRGGGERARRQFLPPPAAEALRRQLEAVRSEWVFPGARGQQQHDAASKQLARACTRAELPRYGFHAVRRWSGSTAMALGVSNKVVARFLGHTQTAATERYMTVEDPLLVRVAEHLTATLAGKP